MVFISAPLKHVASERLFSIAQMSQCQSQPSTAYCLVVLKSWFSINGI